jgi:hypothetical protein
MSPHIELQEGSAFRSTEAPLARRQVRLLAILLPKPRKNIANNIAHIALDFFLTFYFLYNKLLIV